MFDVGRTVQFELVEDGQRVVLYAVEVAVVAVAWHEVSVLTVPFRMFHAHVLGRDHLAVEHRLLGAESLVLLLDQSEYRLYELLVAVVRSYVQTHELRSLYQSVDADGEVLTVDVDVSCIEEWQHVVVQQLLEILVIRQLNFMAQYDHMLQVFLVVEVVVDSILDAAVEIDGQYAL